MCVRRYRQHQLCHFLTSTWTRRHVLTFICQFISPICSSKNVFLFYFVHLSVLTMITVNPMIHEIVCPMHGSRRWGVDGNMTQASVWWELQKVLEIYEAVKWARNATIRKSHIVAVAGMTRSSATNQIQLPSTTMSSFVMNYNMSPRNDGLYLRNTETARAVIYLVHLLFVSSLENIVCWIIYVHMDTLKLPTSSSVTLWYWNQVLYCGFIVANIHMWCVIWTKANLP